MANRLWLKEDLEHILHHTTTLWENFRDKTVFVTGGTGFFGIWLVESFLYANDELGLNAQMLVLTRNAKSFTDKHPHLAGEKAISFIIGDIKDFPFPEQPVHYIIHAATDADAALIAADPLATLDTITIGTRRALDLAVDKRVSGFLLTSSGAVYGKQPHHVSHIKETDSFGVDINNAGSVYTEGKRIAELYCAVYHKTYQLPVKIARCFAFVGPYLPLDRHYAIGNFIGAVVRKERIIIKGDGTAFRSYLYAADLAIWLWTILINGEANVPYNVGSDDDRSIEQIAAAVARSSPDSIDYTVLGTKKPDQTTERYVPSIEKTKSALALAVRVNLMLAVEKTILFYERSCDGASRG